tara:strand:- start:596 stop:1771 length:1176 start_codon:yes stop_codon:yes gene_type:complete
MGKDYSDMSVESIIALITDDHMNPDEHKKYFASRTFGNSEVRGNETVHSITLDEAIMRLILNGNIKLDDSNRVDTNKNPITLTGVVPESNKVVTKIDILRDSIGLSDPAVISIVGKYPKITNLIKGGQYVIDGAIPIPYIGMEPTESELRRSGKDTRHLVRVNRRLNARRKTTIIMRPEVVNGALPCWQERTTFGEDMPFVAGTGQCTECASVVQGYGEAYCDEAIVKSLNRKAASEAQSVTLWGRTLTTDLFADEYANLETDKIRLNRSVKEDATYLHMLGIVLSTMYPKAFEEIDISYKSIVAEQKKVRMYEFASLMHRESALNAKARNLRQAWQKYFNYTRPIKRVDLSLYPKNGCRRDICVSVCEKCMTKKVESKDLRLIEATKHNS